MREIWQSTVEVWSWLMQHLWFINVLLSIVIVFFLTKGWRNKQTDSPERMGK